MATVVFARDHAQEAWLLVRAYSGAKKSAEELCARMRDYSESSSFEVDVSKKPQGFAVATPVSLLGWWPKKSGLCIVVSRNGDLSLC